MRGAKRTIRDRASLIVETTIAEGPTGCQMAVQLEVESLGTTPQPLINVKQEKIKD